MSLYDFLLVFHLLLFVYWLGGDLGVFYSSGMVVDPKLSNSARVTAAKIMVNLDFVPRICMTLMLTVGGLLTDEIGIEHQLWQTVGFLALGPGWLAMVLFLHFNEGTPLGKLVTKIDYYLRWVLVVYLCCSVTFYTFFSEHLATAPWVIAKLGIFAGLVLCGLMIRKYIPDYGAGIGRLRKDEVDDQVNASMLASLNKCRPFVLAIWAGLLLECIIGVAKPGDQERVTEVLGSLAPLVGM
ncbi:MAG: hypothetical protein CL797_04455 [Chromatiales bacterium]|jgi:hypothetical protein|nr:hypothetical protein [Chromatiales bacterium]